MYAAVAITVDEAMDRVAICADRGTFVNAEFVFERLRRIDADGPALGGFAIRFGHVIDFKGDVHDAVAVKEQSPALRVALGQRRGQDKSNLPLLEHVPGLVLDA